MLLFSLLVFLVSQAYSQPSCDIVIVGGTLASLGAAIHALDNAKTCLI
jgi:succinate dehydrogenase/fumarate reductase flavoprotein subunit